MDIMQLLARQCDLGGKAALRARSPPIERICGQKVSVHECHGRVVPGTMMGRC